MKNLFFVLLLAFVFLCSECKSSVPADSIKSGDKLIDKAGSLLPEGWQIHIYKNHENENSILLIQNNKEVYVLQENRINAPVSTETEEEHINRIKKNGKLDNPAFFYDLYDKMSDEEIKTIRNYNDSIQQLIYSLPEKYNIKHLLDKFSLSKGQEIYTGKTDEEKKE